MDKQGRANPFKVIQKLLQDEFREVVFLPNYGNLGDALITLSTYQSFARHKIPIRIASRENIGEIQKDILYVYAGGGNYIPIYHGLSAMMDFLSPKEATLLVLPHSSYGMNEHTDQYQGELIFFCRELSTYKRLATAQCKGSLYHYDDVALLFDLEDPMMKQYHFFRVLHQDAIMTDRLNAFRKDKESKYRRHAKTLGNSMDVSSFYEPKQLRSAIFNPDLLSIHVSWLFTYLHCFSQVHTDRLHVAISALISGKSVVAYDNDYGKISSIYKYSLQRVYGERVSMVDE